MFDIKQAKINAKKQIKEHYIIFTVICLLAAFIGVNYTFSMNAIKSYENEIALMSGENIASDYIDVFDKLIFNSYDKGAQEEKDIQNRNQSEDAKLGGIISVGYRKGVFAGIANSITSGSIFVLIYQIVCQTLNVGEIGGKIAVVFSGLIILLVVYFIKGTYNVSYRRIFLESYIYSEVKASRFLFIFRTGHLFDVAFSAFVKELYQMLWNLTIVGGAIKFFSYSQVYYILAENPSLKPKIAINLSRDMMNGHKIELLKLYLSYLGWMILSVFTFGLSGILYSNAYLESALLEFYVYVRELAIQNKIEYYTKFNDIYLYKFASDEELIKAYPDLYERKDKSILLPDINGVKGFFAKYCGVALVIDDEIKQYNDAIAEKNDAEVFKDIFNKENYPANLGRAKEDIRYSKDTKVVKNKVYSLTNIIVMFFIFSFVGWLWEVLLHIINDGAFVNRGFNHGPWLPIYGAGVVLILLVLYKSRESLPTHFSLSIALCGVVEYFTSFALEMSKGIKWWDYTGYFLNINGRICAEGLLVFGLGGTAAVFLLVPLIDNKLNKIKPRTLTTIAIILSLIFVSDVVYSSKHPNVGKGITDYDTVLIERNNLC